MLAGAGQGELQAAEASLRVPLRIICIPLFNWIYAKGSEWKIPGLAHVVRTIPLLSFFTFPIVICQDGLGAGIEKSENIRISINIPIFQSDRFFNPNIH